MQTHITKPNLEEQTCNYACIYGWEPFLLLLFSAKEGRHTPKPKDLNERKKKSAKTQPTELAFSLLAMLFSSPRLPS